MDSVLVSVAPGDAVLAERIRARLATAGFECESGSATDALDRLSACLVLLGHGGLHETQRLHAALALDEQARRPEFLVIPVLLARSDPPLGFLRLNTWIDLRDPAAESAEMERLVAALGCSSLAQQVARPIDICPYRGLRPFREEDAPFFFGRCEAVDELERRLATRGFVAVVGASGSGKSSVARSGLASRLRHDDSTAWKIFTLTPGNEPLRSLASAVVPLLHPDATGIDRLERIARTADGFAGGRFDLREVLDEALRLGSEAQRVLLLVDQWEELYTSEPRGTTADRAARFVELLLDASADPRVRVVSTVRGDFLDRVFECTRLAERLEGAILHIGPMRGSELREVIERPATTVGLAFEPGLVDRILDDVGDQPGNLPLLEYVLTQLWERCRHGGTVTHEAYSGLGGVRRAIATRAEALLRVHPEREPDLRRVFGRLTRPGTGSGATRRRADIAEFDPDDRELIDLLIKERLVVTTGVSHPEPSAAVPPDADVTVEIAHEALIAGWDRLQEWLRQDREFLRWRQRLQSRVATAVAEPGDRWLRGAALAEALRFSEARGSELTVSERLYVRRSARRSRRKLTAMITGTAMFLATLGGAAVIIAKAEAAAADALDEVSSSRTQGFRVTDPVLADDLIARSQQRWPAAESGATNRAWIREWIEQADAIRARAPAHRAFLASPEADSSSVANELELLLEALDVLDAARADVAGRAAVFTDVRWDRVWATCERDLRTRAEAFGAIVPLRRDGLIPLGRDIDRTTRWPRPLQFRDVGPLWVFAVGGTGELPEWEGVPGGEGRAHIDDRTAVIMVLVPASPELPAFLVAKTELTRYQYQCYLAATERDPQMLEKYGSGQSARHPAKLNWIQSDAYCRWAGLALPSKEQWQSAARAGTSTPFWTGESRLDLDVSGWWVGNSKRGPKPVGYVRDGHGRPVSGLPNPWGLFDVHGNIREWLDVKGTVAGGFYGSDYLRCSWSSLGTTNHDSDRVLAEGVRPCRVVELRADDGEPPAGPSITDPVGAAEPLPLPTSTQPAVDAVAATLHGRWVLEPGSVFSLNDFSEEQLRASRPYLRSLKLTLDLAADGTASGTVSDRARKQSRTGTWYLDAGYRLRISVKGDDSDKIDTLRGMFDGEVIVVEVMNGKYFRMRLIRG